MSTSSNRSSDVARVVIAPDSFKGTATASAVATAIARGWRSVRPNDDLRILPMADGGEGTVAALASALPHALRHHRVTGPDGRPATAQWLRSHELALVELASASGLTLLRELAPWTARTQGLGEVIGAALDDGCRHLIVALGGSASTDGGTGALSALGAAFLDARGRPIAPGAQGLLDLVTVDLDALRLPPSGGAVFLTDVDNPAIGPRGAATVYGPQKGLTPHDARLVDDALVRLADLLGVDPREPGTGAAGATPLALRAWGAERRPGAPAVAQWVGLEAAVSSADLVITGEGRFDVQSASGKVAHFVAAAARRSRVPVALVAGSLEAPVTAFVDSVALNDLAGSLDRAMSETERWLEAAARRLGAQFGAP